MVGARGAHRGGGRRGAGTVAGDGGGGDASREELDLVSMQRRWGRRRDKDGSWVGDVAFRFLFSNLATTARVA